MIETVLGPIEASALGPTSMHEHLLFDARALRSPAREPLPAQRRVTIETLGFLRYNQLALDDNLHVDEPALAAAELDDARAAGLSAVVDLTVWGFGGPAPALPQVAREAGVHVIAGVGAYLGRTQPDWLRALDADQLATLFVRALTERLPGCEHRAGIVGLVGAGIPPAPEEERAVRAAGAAAAQTGSAVVVRVDPRARAAPRLLELLAHEGLLADRVVISNVDGYATDHAYVAELAATGATLKWCFGYEAPPRVGLTAATDAQRIDAIVTLLERGHVRQVLACGAWTKTALRRRGGPGLDHVLRRVVPALRERGVSDDQLDRMLTGEPRRLLDRPGGAR